MRFFIRILIFIGLVLSANVIVASASHEPAVHSAKFALNQTQFVCPMHSHIVKDHQGTCPICGMDLVEIIPSNENMPSSVIQVSGELQQALAIKVEAVRKQTLWQYLKTIGQVQYDESQIYHQHSRVSGWVEKLAINSEGEQVKKGQLLYQLYSPELINAQGDYLLALDTYQRNQSQAQYTDLVARAQQRLELLGVDRQQIEVLKKTKKSQLLVNYYAQKDGVVQTLNVRQGMFIEPKIEVLAIADLQHLWVIAEIFEPNLPWLAKGVSAEVSPLAENKRTFNGKLDYIYPELDPVTRSIRARIILPSDEMHLKASSLVDISLFGGPKHNVLTVPQEALIQIDDQNRVIVQDSDNTFAAAIVEVGIRRQGRAEILSGLKEGQNVVVSGQFLLDSEASLRGSLIRLSNQHQH
ncbi:efflux RND transporter periplasmic adaptor subunit [Shewanella sp. 202IG2-18]|uniref:efflux RND transporter periplasmic adaptor subunit n=1 Tax=Parashewanella hymeniacidonis TaxID=2807618 RepID=UPI0019601CB3|nr:efflux RND transporter periplasmic adaptor subunit [Parashewanella hymeniacidonis]MBM7072798.1 efflux RND transporter periplasmic adaptor subunit [Parashewanella hymeniacidonis]